MTGYLIIKGSKTAHVALRCHYFIRSTGEIETLEVKRLPRGVHLCDECQRLTKKEGLKCQRQ